MIGSTSPAASPASAQRGPASATVVEVARAERRDRPRVRLEPRALRDPGRGHPSRRPSRAAPRRSRRHRPGADADRQMVGARKRPDVARRIGRQLDDDLVARDAVREEPGRDRQLIAAERRARRAGAPGCSRRRRRSRMPARRTPPVSRAWRRRHRRSTSVTRAAIEHGAGALRGRQQRRVEGRATRRRASALSALTPWSSSATTAARPRRGVDEPRGADDRRRAVGRSSRRPTSASARPVTPPPHGFSRGATRRIVTCAPREASTKAARAPAGPAPTITTSSRIGPAPTPNSDPESTNLRPQIPKLRPNPAQLLPATSPVIHYTPMVQSPVGLFTVGVFQDVAWATKGMDALKQADFPPNR